MARVFRSRILTKKWKNVEGIPGLVRNLERVADAVDGKEIIAVLMSGAMTVRDIARAKLAARGPFPYGTGRLASAVFASEGKPERDPRGPSVIAGVSSKRAPHAHFIERGVPARGIAARPFWRPAVSTARPIVAGRIADGLKDLIRKAVH